MHLKRLEIQGFKSFADKTVLDFENGVTAVVGPNGSGKSNISDAIRWVLGEMSAKNLRGANMQDVIFSGTQTRRQLNFAEVSLILDNSDGAFPIEFDEVVVTRKVFRSGETAYMINRAACRLKDIHELFMDTGLGRDGYSIIGQGNVAQILSTKAEDRRSLFEEAAGIAKYKHRKEEARRKLDNVNENLVRITDIASELENQIGPLEKQSEKARRYLVLYEQFKKLDINLTLANLDKNKTDRRKAQELYDSVTHELEGVRTESGEIEGALNALYEQTKKADADQAEKNAMLLGNNTKNMTVKSEISVADTKIKNNNSLTVRIENELEEIKRQNEQRRADIEKSELERAVKQRTVDGVMREFDDIDGKNNELDAKIEERTSYLEGKKADVIELMNAVSSEKAKMNGIDTLRKSFLERRTAVEGELSGHSEGAENTTSEIEKTKKSIDEMRQKRDKMNERIERQRSAKAASESSAAALLNEINASTVEYNSKSSRKKMLEDMENDYEGYARSVKAVLKAPELKRLSVMGTLSSLIEVKREYVTAVETALGGTLQNIVVETEEDAKEAIAYLRRTKAGRATFLPVSSVKGRVMENRDEIARCDGFIGIASELVTYDKRYDGIIKSLLGRVAVFDNIDNGIKVSRKFGYRFRTVTLAGDVLNAGGSMAGGSTGKTGGFLSRANDIKQLGHDINELRRTIDEKREQHERFRSDISAAQSQLELYEPMLREYEAELIRAENNLAHLESSLAESGATRRQLENELKEINEQLEITGADIASLISGIREKENESASLNEEIERLNDERNGIIREKEEKNEQLMASTLRLRDLQNEIENAKREEKKLTAEIDYALEGIALKTEDKKRIEEENVLLSKDIDEKKRLLEQIEKYSAELENNIKALDEQKEAIIVKQKKIQESNRELTDRLMNLQQEQSRAETRCAKLDEERESMINRIWDDYELTVSAAGELREEIENVKAASDELHSLKGKIRALGSVNMDSIEEYKNVKERFEFLTEQKSDLDKSRDNLNKIIDSMQELMEENFTRQFDVINDSFAHVFEDLFGGGYGKIYLTDPENSLESGIEIEVQLPGKSLQNISLYSGGERSFIAVALLFAILNVKPAPFCILDEIDAALDDVNVSRFATYLHNYSQAQFIVITHRRGTMEAANVMYGVTMQEKGVSKLLALHMDEVDDSLIG